MGVESRTLPLYFHPVGTSDYGKNFESIFGKKTPKTEGSSVAPTAAKPEQKRSRGRPAGSKNKTKA